jgi:hypothetical protein
LWRDSAVSRLLYSETPEVKRLFHQEKAALRGCKNGNKYCETALNAPRRTI